MWTRFTSAVALAGAAACTPLRPQVSLASGASLSNYKVFVLGPVEDRTGYPFNLPIGDSVRARMAGALRSHGFTVLIHPADSSYSGPALFLMTTVAGFKSGALTPNLPTALGTSRCDVLTEMSDEQTGKRVGEINAAEISDQEITIQQSPFDLLMTCARMVANEIARRAQSHS
jgi:hypothetical protein